MKRYKRIKYKTCHSCLIVKNSQVFVRGVQFGDNWFSTSKDYISLKDELFTNKSWWIQ